MSTIFRAEGLPQDLLYLCLIESGFSPLAISQTRTAGLWQFTYGTGRAYGLKIDLVGRRAKRSPQIDARSRFLSQRSLQTIRRMALGRGRL